MERKDPLHSSTDRKDLQGTVADAQGRYRKKDESPIDRNLRDCIEKIFSRPPLTQAQKELSYINRFLPYHPELKTKKLQDVLASYQALRRAAKSSKEYIRRHEKNPARFPRILGARKDFRDDDRGVSKRSVAEIRHVAAVLRITFNSLARARHPGLRDSNYDILETKRAWAAERDFLVLAKQLVARNIDPSLYLKIMFLYGRWRDSRSFPPPSWLRSLDAIEIFKWKEKHEREKFERPEDYERSISDVKWDAEYIQRQIERSAETLNPVRRKFKLTVLEGTFFQLPVLSPWFLAVNRAFLELNGVSLLNAEDREAVLQCVHYLKRRKPLLKVATSTFKKVTDF